ncbi:MAG: hypothetical protein CL610_22290 [Anaerolineaceae bacterium]|nr:hypothetical protein [Anaerolineaceae bacterium]
MTGKVIISQPNITAIESGRFVPANSLNGHYAVVMGTAKGWVSVTIFNAQALETPEGMFEASKNGDRKMLKIHQGQAVDSDLLAILIQQVSSTI